LKYSKGGHDFLEKIIQVPLKLPKAQTAAIRKYTLDRIQEVINSYSVILNEVEVKRFSAFFDTHLLPRINNPRLATRYSNSVSFSIPLLIGECNIVDMLLIEGTKVVFPHTYSFIRDNFILLTSNYSSTGTYHNAADRVPALKKLNDFIGGQNNPEVIKELIQQLFPQTKLY
jgi:predicted KAP-like P-loop ATPase